MNRYLWLAVGFVISSSSGSVCNAADYLQLSQLYESLNFESSADSKSSPSFLLDNRHSDSSQVTEEVERIETWFAEFAATQPLFASADVEQSTAALRSLPADELRQWKRQTEPLRNRFDSEAWLRTAQWLNDFWQTQAVYSQEEVVDFQLRMKPLSCAKLLLVLNHFESLHRRILNSRSMASSRRAALPRRSSTVTPRSQQRAATFPQAVSHPPQKRRSPRRNGLSRDIARWYIYRGIFFNRF